MDDFHTDKCGNSSSRGRAQKVVGSQQPPSKTASSIPTWTLTPRISRHGPVTASTSASNPPQAHDVSASSRGSIHIPGFNKRSYGHPSLPLTSSITLHNPHHSASASNSRKAHRSPSKEDQRLNNVCNEAAGQPSEAPVSSKQEQPMTHPSGSGDLELVQNMSPRTSDKKPATYDSLKQEGESPEDVIKRLQGAGLREAHVRMRRRAKGEVVNTGLTTLDFLRRPVSPNTSAHLTTSADPAAPHVGMVSGDPNTTKRPEHNAQNEAKPSKESSEGKYVHNIQTKTQCGLRNPQAEADDRSSFAVQDSSGYPIDSATSKGIRNTSDDIDSAQTDTNLTSKPSLAKTPCPPAAALTGREKWAKSWEMKAPLLHPNINAEGTETSNDDSITPMAWLTDDEHGTAVKLREPPSDKCDLVGWDGQMQPPPVDWECRAQYHNSNPNFISGFEGWLGENTVRTMHNVLRSLQSTQHQDSSTELEFGVLPVEEVQDITKHPDGIGFVSRDTVVSNENARYYGYLQGDEIHWPAVVPSPDFEAVTKIDQSDFETMKYRDETAQTFIDRRMVYLERQKFEVQARRLLAESPMIETPAAPEPSGPKPLKANIYLRPAVRSDYSGMTRIYNWHIEHGVRPTELLEITDRDMEERHHVSTSARLPFIVAVERNRKNSRRKPPNRRVNPNHPVQNTDPTYDALIKDENIVGWAAATDWTASDYIETTTAELEIFVAPDFRQKGVGRCLMDALLDATDRGHVKKGGYDFHVAPEIRHQYNSGGGRDLSKIIFQVRSFNRPITPEYKHKLQLATEATKDWGYAKGSFYSRANGLYEKRKAAKPREEKKDFSKAARIDDREDDYSIWLKEWLESFGFEEEAYLKKIGTKDKRLVDVRYLTKETAWQPVDNQIPDFRYGI